MKSELQAEGYGTFLCAGCGQELPAVNRAMLSPYKRPLCKPCQTAERTAQTRRVEQRSRR